MPFIVLFPLFIVDFCVYCFIIAVYLLRYAKSIILILLFNGGCMRGVTCLCIAVCCWLSSVSTASADDDLNSPTFQEEENSEKSFSTGTNFFDDATVSGGLYYFHRNRVRNDINAGRYKRNLDHASTQASADFTSGFAGDMFGIDVGVFTSADLRNKGAVDHEMGFVPWSNPWHPKWDRTDTVEGVSLYKAHVKFKANPVWAKAGYFQPSGPGVLGVNWSFLPGTYQGVEAGVTTGGFDFAAAWVDKYKAPWYTDTYNFLQRDNTTSVAWLASVGAKYTFPCGFSAEVAYGESENYLKNAHLKLQHSLPVEEGILGLGYHLYGMADSDDNKESVNNHYDGVATQHYIYSKLERNLWTYKLEGTYTNVPQNSANQLGYFAYRLTVPTGSSKGAYSAWWDSRSDWNADQEKSVYLGASRKLDDILPFTGMEVGASVSHGFDGKAYGVAERLSESAISLDAGYTHQGDDMLAGAWIKGHYTEYKNHSSKPSWVGYKNAFQDERDFKLLVGIPLGK